MNSVGGRQCEVEPKSRFGEVGEANVFVARTQGIEARVNEGKKQSDRATDVVEATVR